MEKTRTLLERIPFFNFLLPAFLFLQIENEYRQLINYRFVYFEMIQLVIAALLVFLVSLMFFRELTKASLFAFGFVLIYYYFCDIKDYLQYKQIGFWGSYRFLLPMVFILLLLLFISIKKASSGFRQLFLFLNVLFFILIAWECASLLIFSKQTVRDLGDPEKKLSTNYQPCASCAKPDIYYFSFDAYSSSEVLKSEFQFNNPLDYYLATKNFYVIPHSRSNYNFTPYSIGSVLNLNYLPGLKVDKEMPIKNYQPGRASVYRAELFPMLEKEGYKLINHGIFDIKNYPCTMPVGDLRDTKEIYARHNIFWKADKDIGWVIRQKLGLKGKLSSRQIYVDGKDEYLLHTIDNTLASINKKESQPKFVYSYFFLPHDTNSLDSAGQAGASKMNSASWDDQKKDYIKQIKYSNLVIRQLVESILQQKKRPSVIIIQGDYGYRFNQPEKLHLQFDNFNALYFSNEKYGQIHDSLTNVNTFRFILNAFLQKDLPILPDTSILVDFH